MLLAIARYAEPIDTTVLQFADETHPLFQQQRARLERAVRHAWQIGGGGDGGQPNQAGGGDRGWAAAYAPRERGGRVGARGGHSKKRDGRWDMRSQGTPL